MGDKLEADSVKHAETLFGIMNAHLGRLDRSVAATSAAAARGAVHVPGGLEARFADLDAAISSLRAGLADSDVKLESKVKVLTREAYQKHPDKPESRSGF